MFIYGNDHLTLTKVMAIARGKMRAGISKDVATRLQQSRLSVVQMAAGPSAIYGINTGFGPLCDTRISPEDTHLLQKNLLLTHAVGVGRPVNLMIARLMLIGKIHALCQGYSGIRLTVIERMLYFLEHDLIPLVPEQGSVGASGDLAPLSHLFLPLIGEGELWVNGAFHPAASVLAQHELQPLQLQAKEGLALINGTQFILAHAVIGLDRMRYLLDVADVVGTMSLEGFQGSAAPFRVELHELRPFRGGQIVAQRIRRMLAGSQNISAHANCARVQDPYSIRCMPQVHGASRNAWQHLRELTEIELNAVTDNPIILNDHEAISGGNFHGQPLAMALDYTTVAAAELGNISDRRCYLLLEGKYGLPRLLTKHGGLNSGYMIPQYTTAALVTENKTLCFPASADSIPTSLGQEDHVSMGSISGRKLNQVLTNLEKILAIELMYAAQAMEFRRPNTFSDFIEAKLVQVRQQVPHLAEDRLLKDDIQRLIELLETRSIDVTVKLQTEEATP
ncbi:MAG: histidine ammonia-lyase [Bacteroidota bacterium]